MSSSNSINSIVPVLTGSNWLAFERLMTAYLNSQGLGAHIDPKLDWPRDLEPSEKTAIKTSDIKPDQLKTLKEIRKEYVEFKEDNMKAKGYITLKLAPNLVHLVDDKNDKAEVLWKSLKDKFGKQGLAATFGLYRQIVDWKLKENSNPNTQVPHLMDLINRVSNQGVTLTVKMQIMTILHALPPSWDSFVANLLAHSADDDTVDEFLNLISEEWSRRKGNRNNANTSVVTRGNKHSNSQVVANMARQQLQQGQPRTPWNSYRGKSFRGRGGRKPMGNRRNPTQHTSTGGPSNGPKHTPGQSQTPFRPQWAGQVPNQSKGPNWERNKAAKAKNRANKLAARTAAQSTLGSGHAMASSTSASLPLIARIGDQVMTDFDEEFVPKIYKYKGTRAVPTDDFMGRIDEISEDSGDSVSRDVQKVRTESTDYSDIFDSAIFADTKDTQSLDDLASPIFASSSISHHQTDNEGYQTDNESHQSEANSSGYEGLYTDEEPEEPMPGSFDDEQISWWYVHTRQYYVDQVRRANLEARRMNTNARTIEHLQNMLRGMVIDNDTVSLRPESVSSSDLNYFYQSDQDSVYHTAPESMASSQIPTRPITPYEDFFNLYDYPTNRTIDTVPVIPSNVPIVYPTPRRSTDLHNLYNFDANMRENERYRQNMSNLQNLPNHGTFSELYNQYNLDEFIIEENNRRRANVINIGHLQDPYNLPCSK